LAKCPECRQQADAEAAIRTVLRGHRDSLSGHASGSLRARCADIASRQSVVSIDGDRSAIQPLRARRPSVIRRWAPLSLAATLLLAAAGVFLSGVNNRVQALASSLVMDHVRCFALPGNPTQADLVQSAALIQRRQGWSMPVPQPEPAEDLRLVNVRR